MGKSEFIGHIEDSQFADLETVEEICYWRRGELVAMVCWEHQDKEAPVALGLGVLWIDELQD
jgi:hypothetical protein